jgi:tetratricopeptide (TPR) repeat protein
MLPLVLVAASLAGCDRLFDQKGDEALNMAQEKEKEGDYQAAIRWYEASLDGTPKTAEAHYSMALIYDDQLSDPVQALAQYQRYLQLVPTGEHASDAQNFAAQDQFKLVNVLSKGNFMPQQDAVKLKNENVDLSEKLAEARQEITDMRTMEKESAPKGSFSDDPLQKPIPAGARTYEVQPGDTLRSISRMYYKNPNRWQEIQDANFGPYDGTVKLKVGMELMIPGGTAD